MAHNAQAQPRAARSEAEGCTSAGAPGYAAVARNVPVSLNEATCAAGDHQQDENKPPNEAATVDLDGSGELDHWRRQRAKDVEASFAERTDNAGGTQTTDANWAAALVVSNVAT